MKKMMKIIKKSLVSFLSIWFLFQTLQVSAEEGMENKLDTYIESYLEEYKIPGASVAIVHHNKVFYSKSWGVTGESQKEVTSETPFTIGSISKSLTGLAVMKLVDEERIKLDDPIVKHIPWFKLKDKETTDKITIKHLLTQTSGFSTYDGLSISDQESKELSSIRENVESLSKVDLTASPGEKYQYSNANFLILGALIEEVTNQHFTDYMEEHVFKPLEMKNAAADYDSAYEKGYLSGYQSWFGTPQQSSVSYDNGGAPYGYITASAEDMVNFIQFLSGQNFNDFLSEENKEQYITPHVQTGENRYYGLGIRISNPNSSEKMLWHSGSTPDSHSELFYIPETGWGGIILTNKNHTLEEEGLYYLKMGMINILNGEEPLDIPDNTQIVQFIVLGFILLLFGNAIYLLRKIKSKKINKRALWCSLGIVYIILSMILIPLFIYFTGAPWNTITVFLPDISLLTLFITGLLVLNSILALKVSFSKQ